MGWPEVALAAVAAAQVVLLAWIAAKQAQVKRDLNGNQGAILDQLTVMQHQLPGELHGRDRSAEDDATGRPYPQR